MAKFLRYLALVLALTACNAPLPIADYIGDARSPNAKITTKPSGSTRSPSAVFAQDPCKRLQGLTASSPRPIFPYLRSFARLLG